MTSRDTPVPSASTRRQTLLWILKIVVSAGLLYILFTRLDAANMWRLMRGASLSWIVTALALYLAMVLVSTWRWKLLLEAQHVTLRFTKLLNSYFAATFANNFLPSNIGGDVIRIGDTARLAGSKTLATTVVLADRGLGVLGLAFVAACGSTLAARGTDFYGPILFWFGLVAAATAGALILTRPERLGTLVRPFRSFHADWVDRRIATLTTALHKFRSSPRSLVIAFVASIVVQAVLVAFYAALAAALHIAVPIGHLAILVPISFLVQMAPVSFNGHGVRDWTFIGYLTSIGVSKDSAAALSIFGAALIMIFSMSGAAAYLARRRQADKQ